MPAVPSSPATDDVLMMTPRSPSPSGVLFSITAAARLITLNVPTTLMLHIWVNSLMPVGAPSGPTSGTKPWTPAVLTFMSIVPNRSTAALTAEATCAASAMSAPTPSALSPISLASSTARSARRPTRTTLAPRRANQRTTPRPRPEVAPATSTVFPLISIVSRLSVRGGAWYHGSYFENSQFRWHSLSLLPPLGVAPATRRHGYWRATQRGSGLLAEVGYAARHGFIHVRLGSWMELTVK